MDTTPLRPKPDVATETWIADLEAFVPDLMARAKIPGLALSVIQNAKVVWTGSFGVRANHKPGAVNEATMFQAASLGKPVFAYAVMKLARRGDIDLDTPLSDYLPDYLEGDDRIGLVTARLVLSHQTGLPNWRKHGGLKL